MAEWSFSEAPPGNARSGEKIFKAKCSHCHSVEKDASPKHGPNLNDLFGRHSASVPDFSYSAAHKNMDIIWEEKTLYDYLNNAEKYHPGTRMGFHSVKKPQDRADLIAYLKKSTAS